MPEFKPKEKPEMIVLGKSKPTKVLLHPVLGVGNNVKKIKNEAILDKIKKMIIETKADQIAKTYTNKDYEKAGISPFDVLADPNAPSTLKDLAMANIMYWQENEEEDDVIMEKAVSSMTPQEKLSYVKRTKADIRFFKNNPSHPNNIIQHYKEATSLEKEHGMNWYSDLHETSKDIAASTKTDMTTMAGIFANYSPQTPWSENVLTAARVARTKKAIGGPQIKYDPEGNRIIGVMASNKQKGKAERILAGEHYDNVLSGHKVKAFAHLIEFGGNDNDLFPKVAVDRHALGVAIGKKINQSQFDNSGLKSESRYNEISNHYVQAAKTISAQEGKTVHPHQVQAITWLVRQRKNEQERNQARAIGIKSKGGGGVVSRDVNAKKQLDKYLTQHHPHLLNKIPGTGYSSKEKGEK